MDCLYCNLSWSQFNISISMMNVTLFNYAISWSAIQFTILEIRGSKAKLIHINHTAIRFFANYPVYNFNVQNIQKNQYSFVHPETFPYLYTWYDLSAMYDISYKLVVSLLILHGVLHKMKYIDIDEILSWFLLCRLKTI